MAVNNIDTGSVSRENRFDKNGIDRVGCYDFLDGYLNVKREGKNYFLKTNKKKISK